MTTLVRADAAGSHRTGTTEVHPGAVEAVAAHLAAAAHALAAADGSGLLASTLLRSEAEPGAPDDAAVRLVQLTRWVSPDHAAAAGAALDPGAGLREGVTDHVVHDLDVHTMVTASGEQQVHLGEDGPATFVISMDCSADQVEFLARFNVEDTRRLFVPEEGFVACAVFSDHRRERVFELAQWERPDHFATAASKPSFAAHDAVVRERCHTVDARLFRVVHTVTSASPDAD